MFSLCGPLASVSPQQTGLIAELRWQYLYMQYVNHLNGMARSSPPSRSSVSTHKSEIRYSINSQSLDPKQRHQCQSKMIWERKEGEQNSEGQQKDSNIESSTMADWCRSGRESLVKLGKAFLIKFPQDDIKKK